MCLRRERDAYRERAARGRPHKIGSAEPLKDGYLVLYGPYRYGGEFTTESNKDFDGWLKDRDSASGVRDFEWVERLTNESGLTLIKDHAMPANNQCLVFKKGP